MTNEEAIKFLQKIYPNGGHCWLDEQRIEAISMAIKALQEEPVSEDLEEEITKCYKSRNDLMMTRKQFGEIIHRFTEWQKEQMHGEEPVSEELENAAFDYADACKYYGTEKLLCVEHFKGGAKWQEKQDQETIELAEDHAMLAGIKKMKEQMMAKAVDVEVKVDAGGYPYIPQMELYDYDNDVPLAKEGDKYKVILIKEE